MRLRFKFTKYKLDRTRFTKALGDKLISCMNRAARQALRETYHLVPVYTGESRGGLRAVARALGVEEVMHFVPRNRYPQYRKRKGRWVLKTPTSARSNYVAPHRRANNVIVAEITNTADGFRFNDKAKTSISKTSPWKFAATFNRKWKKYTLKLLREEGIPITSFRARQRRVG